MYFLYFFSEIKHAFAIYDRDGEGEIQTRELGAVLKSLGQEVTRDELIDLMNEVDYEGMYPYRELYLVAYVKISL